MSVTDDAGAAAGVPTLTVVGDRSAPGGTYVPKRDLEELRRVLNYALARLRAKKRRIDLAWRYHDGNHPQLWMTAKLKEVFGREFEGSLQDNYCRLAVEAPVLRLGVEGWQSLGGNQEVAGGDATAGDAGDTGPASDADKVQELWDANELDLDQDELYRAERVAGEAYLIVWPRYDPGATSQATTEAGTPLYDVAVNDARCVHLELGANRRQRLWAAKVWLDGGAKGGPSWRANIYYPDELARLRMPARRDGASSKAMPSKAERFELDPDDPGGPNPMRTVGVFRFARTRNAASSLTDLVPIQDKINKLAANKMVAAEFQAWRQRVLLTTQDIPDAALRPSPGGWMLLDPGGKTDDNPDGAPETKVVQLEATDLAIYDNAKSAEVDTFFTLALLPRHLRVSPGQPPSGEAIRADESPFLSLIGDLQANYGASWRDLWAALGYRVEPAWENADPGSDVATYNAVAAVVNAKCPLDVALRVIAGWDDDDLDDLRARMGEEADKASAQQAEAQRLLQGALDMGGSAGGPGDAGFGGAA